ncbi:MAG TPA: hypothetical protein VK912_02830 [Longimicrobiales bacterium]|nr:hypothetical protein [Longimicrobiales bacterium]
MIHIKIRRTGHCLAGILAAACVALFRPAEAAAQDYDTSVGWGGGYVQYAPFIESGEDSPVDIGFGGTWIAGLQAEGWDLGGWLGVRLGGSYSHGTITLPNRNIAADAWNLETTALVRIVPPAVHRSMTAYLIGGGGVTWFGFGEGDEEVLIEGSNVAYNPEDTRQLTVLGGAGIEMLTGIRVTDGQLGLRLEGVDQLILDHPFRPLDGSDPGSMHNIRATLTLFAGVGSLF